MLRSCFFKLGQTLIHFMTSLCVKHGTALRAPTNIVSLDTGKTTIFFELLFELFDILIVYSKYPLAIYCPELFRTSNHYLLLLILCPFSAAQLFLCGGILRLLQYVKYVPCQSRYQVLFFTSAYLNHDGLIRLCSESDLKLFMWLLRSHNGRKRISLSVDDARVTGGYCYITA